MHRRSWSSGRACTRDGIVLYNETTCETALNRYYSLQYFSEERVVGEMSKEVRSKIL
jgi:hypothetical protein